MRLFSRVLALALFSCVFLSGASFKGKRRALKWYEVSTRRSLQAARLEAYVVVSGVTITSPETSINLGKALDAIASAAPTATTHLPMNIGRLRVSGTTTNGLTTTADCRTSGPMFASKHFYPSVPDSGKLVHEPKGKISAGAKHFRTLVPTTYISTTVTAQARWYFTCVKGVDCRVRIFGNDLGIYSSKGDKVALFDQAAVTLGTVTNNMYTLTDNVCGDATKTKVAVADTDSLTTIAAGGSNKESGGYSDASGVQDQNFADVVINAKQFAATTASTLYYLCQASGHQLSAVTTPTMELFKRPAGIVKVLGEGPDTFVDLESNERKFNLNDIITLINTPSPFKRIQYCYKTGSDCVITFSASLPTGGTAKAIYHTATTMPTITNPICSSTGTSAPTGWTLGLDTATANAATLTMTNTGNVYTITFKQGQGFLNTATDALVSICFSTDNGANFPNPAALVQFTAGALYSVSGLEVPTSTLSNARFVPATTVPGATIPNKSTPRVTFCAPGAACAITLYAASTISALTNYKLEVTNPATKLCNPALATTTALANSVDDSAGLPKNIDISGATLAAVTGTSLKSIAFTSAALSNVQGRDYRLCLGTSGTAATNIEDVKEVGVLVVTSLAGWADDSTKNTKLTKPYTIYRGQTDKTSSTTSNILTINPTSMGKLIVSQPGSACTASTCDGLVLKSGDDCLTGTTILKTGGANAVVYHSAATATSQTYNLYDFIDNALVEEGKNYHICFNDATASTQNFYVKVGTASFYTKPYLPFSYYPTGVLTPAPSAALATTMLPAPAGQAYCDKDTACTVKVRGGLVDTPAGSAWTFFFAKYLKDDNTFNECTTTADTIGSALTATYTFVANGESVASVTISAATSLGLGGLPARFYGYQLCGKQNAGSDTPGAATGFTTQLIIHIVDRTTASTDCAVPDALAENIQTPNKTPASMQEAIISWIGDSAKNAGYLKGATAIKGVTGTKASSATPKTTSAVVLFSAAVAVMRYLF